MISHASIIEMQDIITSNHANLINILYHCLWIFGIAGLIVPVFNRMHISSVLGFLLCGIILSPNMAQIYEGSVGQAIGFPVFHQESITLMGELGVMALLFMIGLELSYDTLRELKRYIFGLGLSQIVVTGTLITLIAAFFENSIQTAIIVGVAFTLSSTAIVMQLLKDHQMHRRPIGQMSFSILLMQDLAVVPILIMIGAFAYGDNTSHTPLLMVFSLAVALIVVGLIYFIGKRLLQPALNNLAGTNKNEWITAFVLFVICLIAMITEKVGLSHALGAFLAGLLIAETEFHDRIKVMLYPLKAILLGVFFISVGMMVDLVEVMTHPLLLGLSVVGIFLIKGLTLYPLCRGFGINHPHARDISIILCQPGEFTLMIISVALAMGILPTADAQFFLLVCVLGMIITPLLFRFIPSIKDI